MKEWNVPELEELNLSNTEAELKCDGNPDGEYWWCYPLKS